MFEGFSFGLARYFGSMSSPAVSDKCKKSKDRVGRSSGWWWVWRWRWWKTGSLGDQFFCDTFLVPPQKNKRSEWPMGPEASELEPRKKGDASVAGHDSSRGPPKHSPLFTPVKTMVKRVASKKRQKLKHNSPQSHNHANTQRGPHPPTHTHTHTPAGKRTRTRTRTPTRSRARARARALTHTHTHTHKRLGLSFPFFSSVLVQQAANFSLFSPCCVISGLRLRSCVSLHVNDGRVC